MQVNPRIAPISAASLSEVAPVGVKGRIGVRSEIEYKDTKNI